MTSDRPPSSRIGVWLELDFEAQPIQGTLSASGGPPNPFVGWLGLTAALERLRSGHDLSKREKLE